MGIKTINLYFKWLLLICGVVAFILLTIVNYHINEEFSSGIVYYVLSLMIPFIIVLNMILLIYWAIIRDLRILIPLLALLINYRALMLIFGFNLLTSVKSPSENITVASLNVNYFRSGADVVNVSEVSNIVARERVDIVAFQEFEENDYYNLNEIKGEFDYLPYCTADFSSFNKTGTVIFSRYPIVRSMNISYTGTKNGIVWADIAIGRDTIRLFSNHLHTTGVSKNMGEGFGYIIQDAYKNYGLRALQAKRIRHIADTSSYPVIMCGDFNDTPFGRCTSILMGNNLKDSFTEAGKWAGGTYLSRWFFARIDYILVDSKFVVNEYKTIPEKISDHKMIISKVVYRN